jgi:hypothetical protein
MATNPDRPQYQDIIDEAWGQSVADHVIRRYRDAAERDADLAGISPADLAGQVVAIVDPAGVPFLEQHDGAAWISTVPAPYRQPYQRDADVPSGSTAGVAPPSSPYHTQSAGAYPISLMTFTRDCMFVAHWHATGASGGTYLSLNNEIYSPNQDWGGNWHHRGMFSKAMRASETVDIYFIERTGAAIRSHFDFTYTAAPYGIGGT